MKFIAILALLLVAGCGDDSSTSVKGVSYDGHYEISAEPIDFHCFSRDFPHLPESVIVDVDGDEIDFGGIFGTFDTSTKTAVCVSTECHEPHDACLICETSGVDVVFTDSRHLEGTFYIRQEFSFGCTEGYNCTAEWNISGTKVRAPPTSND